LLYDLILSLFQVSVTLSLLQCSLYSNSLYGKVHHTEFSYEYLTYFVHVLNIYVDTKNM